MPTVKVYNTKGEKVEDLELSDTVFDLKENNDLLHQAYITISGNQRQVLAHTKDRGERSGSGKKPWRQKGTGNARAGSVRSPLWRKGGVTFGPTKDKNFKRKINKKMMKKAIRIVLSGKVRSKSLLVLEKISLAKKKTAEFSNILKNLKIKGSMLISFNNTERELRLFSRNIEKVKNILTENLNVYDMLNNKYLILSKDSVKYLEEKYKTHNV